MQQNRNITLPAYPDPKQAEAWIREHREELILEIQRLVQIPSVSRPGQAAPGSPFGPECRRALDHMLARGEAYGFRTRNLDGWAGTVSMGNEENAIGIIAHLDVVPVGDGWVYPPFAGTFLRDRDVIIGRGADDNKGPAMACLFVMRMLRDLNVPLRRGIRLYCGVSEENGMMDMRHLAESGEPFPALSLVPDAGFPVNYGQKGSIRGEIAAQARGNLLSLHAGKAVNIIPDLAECVADVSPETARAALNRLEDGLREKTEMEETPEGVRFRAHGVSGHAAFPDGGVNAIYLLAKALTEMDLLTGSARDAVRSLADLASDAFLVSEGAAYSDDLSGKTTLVYSMAELSGGVLRVGLDCRYSITCDGNGLREKLEQAWRGRGYTAEALEVSEPFYIPVENEAVQALQQVYRGITGRDDAPYTMGGGTYSRVVPNAISFGFGMPGAAPDLSFLPEGHGHAHGRDEALPVEKVCSGMRIYAAALAALDQVLA